MAAVLFGEAITVMTVAGMALTALGVSLVVRQTARSTRITEGA
jgi:drug/metabolite transporter (DMT)-like permease